MGSDTSSGFQKTEGSEGNIKPPAPQIDTPRAERMDSTTIVQPSAKPFTHSAPPSGQLGTSSSSTPSHAATVMTKTPSSRMPTHRGMPVGENHTWSGMFRPNSHVFQTTARKSRTQTQMSRITQTTRLPRFGLLYLRKTSFPKQDPLPLISRDLGHPSC